MQNTATVTTFGLRYWVSLTLQTRNYGHTYVHSAARASCPRYDAFTHDNINFTYTGWGRSLEAPRGHKYKVHARYADTGKPVPSKVLHALFAL